MDIEIGLQFDIRIYINTMVSCYTCRTPVLTYCLHVFPLYIGTICLLLLKAPV